MPPAAERIYLDNAATSHPKPPAVIEAVRRYMTEIGASPGRGAYAESIEAGRILMRCRDLINQLIHGESGDQVVFTLNCTDALNLAIKGVARHRLRNSRSGPPQVITTEMDHNSILRPLNALKDEGVAVVRIAADPESGRVDPRRIAEAMTDRTCLVATIHGSNVTGTLQPIEDIGAICRGRGVPFLVDAAQTIGHVPIDVQAMDIDLLAFPGHKGLLGPLGTGGLYIRPGLESMIDPLREGGTGSRSESDSQPTHMPDRFEPGSHNAPGIAGLAEGVAWILSRGIDTLWAHERSLMAIMLEGLLGLREHGVRVLGSQQIEHRCGVFSMVMEDGLEPPDLAAVLEESYGILVRPGLHCAPLAHRAMGTSPIGATRLSLGPFLTEAQVRYAVASLGEICRDIKPHRQSPPTLAAVPSATPANLPG